MFFCFWGTLFLVRNMRNTKYDKIADHHKAKENRLGNFLAAFLSGGVVGALGEGTIEILCFFFSLSRSDASVFMITLFIFLACLLTAFGYFDKMVHFCRCGLIIPITGFAHSMMSSTLDYKEEGLIYGIGSNMFKLAGSVILYGVVSAWFFGLIRYVLEVVFG